MTRLGDVAQFIADVLRKYVVLQTEQTDALALWVLHTYAFDAADCTVYINISSPEATSGKTRLLETLELLVARPWLTGRVTAAVLARKIDAECPTLLLDETDAAFASGDEYAEVLRGVLNSGYRRSGRVSLCTGKGTEIKYMDLATFCPKAFAGLKRLPDTVEARSVPIRLKRRTVNEPIQKLRRRQAEGETAALRQWLGDWAVEAVPILREARPEIPETLSDRAADCWEPLFAIADLTGGEWPTRSRLAAVVLYGQGADTRESTGTMLLTACKDIFVGTDRITTVDLLKALVDLDTGPWAEWWGKDVGLNRPQGPASRLARMLKPYGILPGTIRTSQGTAKGYYLADFEDAFARYLPPVSLEAVTSVTASQDMTMAGAACDGVTAVTASTGDKGPNGELSVHPIIQKALEVFNATVLQEEADEAPF